MNVPASRKLLYSQLPGTDYGIFLLATPLVAVVALLIVALAYHSLPGFIWLLAATTMVSACFAAGEIFQSHTAWESGSPIKLMLGWWGFVALLWPVGYPAYLRGRRRFKFDNWLPGALIVEALFIAGAILAAVIIFTSYGKPPPQAAAHEQKNPVLLIANPHWIPDPDDVRIVKTGYLNNCQEKTVEQEVNSFFASPHWQAGATAEGRDFVNVSGTVTYLGRPTTAMFQFLMDKDKNGFKYHAFTVNGVPQTIYVAAFTLAEMCAAAHRAPIVVVPQAPGAS